MVEKHTLILSINKHLLKTYFMSVTLLDTGDTKAKYQGSYLHSTPSQTDLGWSGLYNMWWAGYVMISIFQRAGEHRKGHPRLPGASLKARRDHQWTRNETAGPRGWGGSRAVSKPARWGSARPAWGILRDASARVVWSELLASFNSKDGLYAVNFMWGIGGICGG